MNIYYATDQRPRLRLYVDPERNTSELERDEAERIARRIASRDGYARVVFGGAVLAEYGRDPRLI